MPIFIIILIILIIIALVVFVFSYFLFGNRRDYSSGIDGENEVSNFLNTIKQDDEVVIDNYLASRNREKTHSIQIDHIFISHKGIFVIEKNLIVVQYMAIVHLWNGLNTLVIEKINFIIHLNKTKLIVSIYMKNLERSISATMLLFFLNAALNCDQGCSDKLFSIDTFSEWYSKLESRRYLSANEINRIQDRINYLQSTHIISQDQHIQNVKNNHY